MPIAICPSPEQLGRLARGEVSAADVDALEGHVLGCAACAAALKPLAAQPDILTRAMAANETTASLPIVKQLMRVLQSQGPKTAARDTPAPQEVDNATIDLDLPELAVASLTDFLAPKQQPDEIGRLGAFRVLKILGHGGMGVVFQAEDSRLDRLVALKAMLPALAADPTAKARFLREAKAAASVHHPHIVVIHHVEEKPVPHLAMEFLEGEALDTLLQRERVLPAREVARIGREIAEGLAAAHARQLIHRDIKPGNIWLAGEARSVKILDFGLARALSDTSQLTRTGAIVGTPAYMAPEQARGVAVDYRGDLFSLGCVLYRLSTGEMPFKGDNTISILSSLALDQPPSPAKLDRRVPGALSKLIMDLLEKDPANRLATATEIAARLKAIESSPANVSISPVGRAVRPGRRGVFAAALLLAVLLVGGIAAGILLRETPQGGPLDPLAARTKDPPKTPDGTSPLDNLDPEKIPELDRRRWQPKELVAILGNQHRNSAAHRAQLFVSPDGKWLAVRSGAGLFLEVYETATMRLKWDSMDFEQTTYWQLGGFLGDSQHLFAGNRIWNLAGDRPTVVAAAPADLPRSVAAAVATAKPLVALADQDGTVRLFDFANGTLTLRRTWSAGVPGNRLEQQVEFAEPDGRTLVTRLGETFKIWDTTLDPPKELADGKAVQVAVNVPSRLMAVGNEDDVALWNLAATPPQKIPNWSVLGKFDFTWASDLAFSKDGQRLLICRADGSQIVSATPKKDLTLATVPGVTGGAAFSPDGKTLYVQTLRGELRILDARSDARGDFWLERPRPHFEMGVPIFSPDGRQLLTQPIHGLHSTSLWDLTGAAPVERELPESVRRSRLLGWRDKSLVMIDRDRLLTWTGEGKPRPLLERFEAWSFATATLSADGQTMAVARDALGPLRTIEVWNLRDAPPSRTTFETTSYIHRLQLSADGQRLVVGAQGTQSQLWIRERDGKGDGWKEAWSRAETARDGAAISPRGDRLASIAPGEGDVWNASSLPPRPIGAFAFADPYLAQFSPDGETLVVAGNHGGKSHVTLIDARSANPRKTWTPLFSSEAAGFAPDGRHLALECRGAIWILRLAPPGKTK